MMVLVHIVETRVANIYVEADSVEQARESFEKDYFTDPAAYDAMLNVCDTQFDYVVE